MNKIRHFCLLTMVILVLKISEIKTAITINYVTISLVDNKLVTNYDQIINNLSSLATQNCRYYWLLGVTQLNITEGYTKEPWIALIDCSDQYIPLIQIVFPNNEILAKYSVNKYPLNADSWFWFGKSLRNKHPDETIIAYRNGLKLSPQNAEIWCRLGNLYLEMSEGNNSIDAFKECCSLSYNKTYPCYTVGALLEKKNLYEEAIYYYKLANTIDANIRINEINLLIDK